MREGYKNDLLTIGDKFVGINFGSDMCAEHEWGIKSIRLSFGMEDDKDGLARRLIRKVPTKTYYGANFAEIKARDGSFRGFEFSYYHPSASIPKERPQVTGKRKRELQSWEEPIKLWTAWSEQDFGVVSDVPAIRAKLRFVYDAILRCDAAIWLGGGHVFHNAGFVIAVASELPAHVTQAWLDGDLEHLKLLADAEATGIEKELRAAGKDWYALSPRRENDKIVFWLNPTEQRIHSHGWFTVEQLRQWAKDTGPVMMKKGNRA